MTGVLAGVYLAGVLVALLRTDAPFGSRLALALCWPVAPLAFVVTVAALVVAGGVAFPLFGLALVALAAAVVLLR